MTSSSANTRYPDLPIATFKTRSFRSSPRQGRLNKAQRPFVPLLESRHGAPRIHIGFGRSGYHRTRPYVRYRKHAHVLDMYVAPSEPHHVCTIQKRPTRRRVGEKSQDRAANPTAICDNTILRLPRRLSDSNYIWDWRLQLFPSPLSCRSQCRRTVPSAACLRRRQAVDRSSPLDTVASLLLYLPSLPVQPGSAGNSPVVTPDATVARASMCAS